MAGWIVRRARPTAGYLLSGRGRTQLWGGDRRSAFVFHTKADARRAARPRRHDDNMVFEPTSRNPSKPHRPRVQSTPPGARGLQLALDADFTIRIAQLARLRKQSPEETTLALLRSALNVAEAHAKRSTLAPERLREQQRTLHINTMERLDELLLENELTVQQAAATVAHEYGLAHQTIINWHRQRNKTPASRAAPKRREIVKRVDELREQGHGVMAALRQVAAERDTSEGSVSAAYYAGRAGTGSGGRPVDPERAAIHDQVVALRQQGFTLRAACEQVAAEHGWRWNKVHGMVTREARARRPGRETQRPGRTGKIRNG